MVRIIAISDSSSVSYIQYLMQQWGGMHACRMEQAEKNTSCHTCAEIGFECKSKVCKAWHPVRIPEGTLVILFWLKFKILTFCNCSKLDGIACRDPETQVVMKCNVTVATQDHIHIAYLFSLNVLYQDHIHNTCLYFMHILHGLWAASDSCSRCDSTYIQHTHTTYIHTTYIYTCRSLLLTFSSSS